MAIKSLSSLKNLQNKTILLRVDFNVPIKDGRIQDDYRLQAGLETIAWLLSQKARLIIMTHLGSPTNSKDQACSVKPLARHLQKLLKHPVKYLPAIVGPLVRKEVAKLKSGNIIFLENLRFNPGELNNDQKFAQELAALADIYVNDAFSVCHRDQASVSAIKKYLPSYAGLLLEKEILALKRVLRPKKPLVIIMGGAKISTKAPLIKKLYAQADKILLGGALANNFFKFQKLEIGRSLIDSDSDKEVKQFFKNKKLAAKIILPLDVVVKTKEGESFLRKLNAIKKTDQILDIGPETISAYSQYIKTAATLIWNGPLGKFEEASFKQGTLSIARALAARSSGPAYGVVGGGETIEALKLSKMAEYIDWVSTGGGALLSYLAGERLPGLEKIT